MEFNIHQAMHPLQFEKHFDHHQHFQRKAQHSCTVYRNFPMFHQFYS